MTRTRSGIVTRGAGLLVAVVTAAGLVAGCGDGGSGSGDDKVTIRFAWWGTDVRAKTTREVIAAFEAANPGIEVEPQTSDFASYFDKLATDTAAGDAPDVMTLGGAYPREYSDRGALLDLKRVANVLDTSRFSADALGSGQVGDALYGVPTGGNAIGMIVNPAVFEDADVDLPDTGSWTWADFSAAAAEVTRKSAKGTYGFEPRVNDTLGVYAAQRGTPIFDAAGKLAVAPATIEAYWQMQLQLLEDGGTPDAEQIAELAAVDPAQTLMGRGKAAMTVAYSNLLGTYQQASGADLKIVPMPGEHEFARPGVTVLPSQFYAISSRSEHTEEAAKLVAYLVGSPEAGRKILDDRGLPFNTEVRDAIQPLLTESGRSASEYLATVEANGAGAVPIPPAGGSALNDITAKLDSDVLFRKQTPAQAAQKWHEEMEAALSAAS